MSGCGSDKKSSCSGERLDRTSVHQGPSENKILTSKDICCPNSTILCCDSEITKQIKGQGSLTHYSLMSDYSIPKMDCSAEEQMVRIALSSFENIEQLIFDLPNRSLKVLHDEDVNLITAKLEALDFGATLVKTEEYKAEQTGQETSTYILPKMDCSAEEQMVRMTLSSVEEVKGLEFDLPNRQLQVAHTGGLDKITSKLETLGYGAKLESTVKSEGSLPETIDLSGQSKILKILLAINAALFLIEFTCGIIAASTGLIADSLDMFADAAVYGIALYAVGKAAKYQLKAAHFAGWIQLVLATTVIIDVIRRFIYGSEPESFLMIGIGILALIANVTCLYLISGHKDGGAHMKASWIFSANDVIVNMGVIVAGILVAWTGSSYPDLVIGIIVSLFVLNGARKILTLK
ncbi:Zinc transporter ZitB [Acinetobacter oleivorans]|uniref:HMA domain-containing protein n=2 Tax=Acinetobacter beijerinckii TaxID=262668 RepID=N9FE09_9GAMM|nr:hypothetical protein F933_03141 [Acinetobacter beijerinckii CIP 110307]OTS55808.1 cation transporter [Acinetobacter pittii]CAI3124395.1 Zinc transporter ZitB [Acinetobacter oleivorans]CAI3125048.1 Zinc transporter ZitB [Acinetobacter oleivorans]CAI3125058.1 Zinc transporter ZitB [Acinetobacter oleivorans]